MTENANPDRHFYFGYILGVDARINGCGIGKNVVIICADMSPSVKADNKKKYILILSKGSTNGLDDTRLIIENKYHMIFT